MNNTKILRWLHLLEDLQYKDSSANITREKKQTKATLRMHEYGENWRDTSRGDPSRGQYEGSTDRTEREREKQKQLHLSINQWTMRVSRDTEMEKDGNKQGEDESKTKRKCQENREKEHRYRERKKDAAGSKWELAILVSVPRDSPRKLKDFS